jgi:hypothetical protein
MALGQNLRTLAAAAVLAVCLVMAVGCEEVVTEENFERVTVGMSYGEVEGILGAGQREDSGGYGSTSGGIPTGNDSGSSKQQTYVWEDDGKQIVVVFNDGKVQSKSKMGSW